LAEQGDLAGVHFEGPFISCNRRGAHDESLLRDPDPGDVRKLLDAARGRAVMMTLAPERPGGLDSVRLLADSGVIAAIGHTDGDYEGTREAVDAGATVATHLFNAMPPLGHRQPGPIAALLEDDRVTVELINDGTHLHPMPPLGHRQPGPIAALLEDDRVTVELINDGTHLHPAVLGLAFEAAGPGRVAFITDAMGAAGM
ncbi:hypothetical protein AN219_07100, partial [Streptomyces nanshensis]